MDSEEKLVRRTRSGRKVSVPATLTTPTRTRRISKRQTQDQLSELEEESVAEDKQNYVEETNNLDEPDIIQEMLAEAAHGVIDEEEHEIDDGEVEVVYEDQEQVIETVEIIEEVPEDDECVVTQQQILEDDVEMYAGPEDEAHNTEVPTITEVAIDEKSSSFPFGTVAQSETSEEAIESNNDTGPVENSLLASLVGDNANSLPSVGCSEEVDGKKDDFESKCVETIEPNCEKMDSNDSLSEPAIAEDIVGGADNVSNATIVNTELVSEDELPLPTKPEINDAEEVSDDELPAPQRAELPADAEVISEDELPTTTTTTTIEKKSPHSSPVHSSKGVAQVQDAGCQKRKVDEDDKSDRRSPDQHKSESERKTKGLDEQYNPMSPTTESNDGPVEKKPKIEEVEHKEKKRDREKEKEKEKERKRLPDLDKYWRAVKDDPADFTGWTYLLQYVDNESDAEAAREAYDAFLSHYPYCYGYWRKYADYEKRKGIKANCNAVFERGLEAIPLSVDLWIHYLSHVKSNNADNEDFIREQFERATKECGLEFRSDKLWDAYIKWENDGKRYQNVLKIFDRLLAIPTQGYSGHFDNFQDLINQHSIASTIGNEELKKIRMDLREAASSRSSSSRSKSRRNSKEKEKDKEREKDHSSNHKDVQKKDDEVSDNKSPAHKDHDTSAEEIVGEIAAGEGAEKAAQDDLGDPSTLTDEEQVAVKDKVISLRRKIHKSTVAAVTARWSFEEGIKRPYFHVKPLERCQLKNWKDYLDFEIEKCDRTRILVLFERCLIACALYDEFWLKYVRYLESQLDQPGIAAITSDVFRRACEIHHPDKPNLHLMWAAFEECQNNFDHAADILANLEKKCSNLLQVAYRRINVERRRGDLVKCRELYEHHISTAKNKSIAGSLAIKYARFLNKICNDLDGGLHVLQQTLDKDPANTRVALQMIDLALQRSKVDEDEIVLIMDKFMTREGIDPEQKVLFAQRKVEFLEDFGSTAKGLQDAQRALQLALNKANEAKKKRESSPNRKSSTGIKESSNISSNLSQSSYNNGSTPVSFNYNSTNSAYYGQQSGGAYQQPQQQPYDSYYNHWQFGGSGYSNYGQWSGYGNYY